jgi:transcriptional regulator with XRE-family HTH domain
MSQRQLAARAGIDHATVSRLLRNERAPTLKTATSLARALRELRHEVDTPQYFNRLATSNPASRVEYALRADKSLDDRDVHEVMRCYLNRKARRRPT